VFLCFFFLSRFAFISFVFFPFDTEDTCILACCAFDCCCCCFGHCFYSVVLIFVVVVVVVFVFSCLFCFCFVEISHTLPFFSQSIYKMNF